MYHVSHNNENGQNLTPPPKKKQQKKNKLYIAESLAFDPKVLAFKWFLKTANINDFYQPSLSFRYT